MKKEFDNEVKYLSLDIIKDKCNNKTPNHEVIICNFNNMIVDRFYCHLDKKFIEKILLNKQFNIVKRREADHYVKVCEIGSDISKLNFWIKQQ